MTAVAGMHGQKKKHRSKNMGKAKKEKKESSVKELESVITRCKELAKVSGENFALLF